MIKMSEGLQIKKLSVQSFRGINCKQSLDFSNKNIIVLYGENGFGKSSFVTALEFLFAGKLSMLMGSDIDKKSFLHKNSKQEDLLIELQFDNDEYVKRTYKESECSPSLDYLVNDNSMNNASFILTRKKLLEFVDSTPKDRYEAIIKLCGFEKLDYYQKELGGAFNSLKKQKSLQKSKMNGIIGNISKKLNKPFLDYDQILDETNLIFEDIGINGHLGENTDISVFAANLDKFFSSFSIVKYLTEFNELYDSLNFSELNEDLRSLLKSYEMNVNHQLKSSNKLFELLKNSKEYMTLYPEDKCPVCNSKIDRDSLITDLDSNIKNLENELFNFDIWKKDAVSFISRLKSYKNDFYKLEDIVKNISDFDESIDININFNEELKLLDGLIGDLENLMKFEHVVVYLSKYDLTDLGANLEIIKNDIDNNSPKLSEGDYSKIINLKSILDDLIEYNILKKEYSDLDKQCYVAEKSLETFKGLKEQFINDMVLIIKDDVAKYYEFIHGEDKINSPSFSVKSDRGIKLFLNSFGKDVDPRSYASEGHLDTLGLCIFLAFVNRFSKMKFLVLDDIVSSVDLQHKSKIIKLLFKEFNDYQFLITTHSHIWAEQIRRFSIARKLKAKIYEISDWTLEEGPVINEILDYEARIKKYLEKPNPDKNAAANTARRYLEYFLYEFAKANEVELPVKEHYMVGTLENKVGSFILKAVKGTALENYYADLWEDFCSTCFYANYLSHNNYDSEDLTYNDIKEFCDSVLLLKKALICEKHNNHFLIFNQEKHSISCPQKRCNYIFIKD